MSVMSSVSFLRRVVFSPYANYSSDSSCTSEDFVIIKEWWSVVLHVSFARSKFYSAQSGVQSADDSVQRVFTRVASPKVTSFTTLVLLACSSPTYAVFYASNRDLSCSSYVFL